MSAKPPLARTRRRQASLRIAGRVADAFTRAIPDDVPAIPVLLRAIERATVYFDQEAQAILENPEVETAEARARVEALGAALGQAIGGSLALLELLPLPVLELFAADSVRWLTIDPFRATRQ